MDLANDEDLVEVSPPSDPGPAKANVKRPRGHMPKVKTGCITCNTPGQGSQSSSRTNSSTPPAIPSQSASNALAMTHLRPSGLDSGEEIRCFDYFRSNTGPQLAGFFPSEFWSVFILRATMHEPIIKHAILALGSLHERFVNGDKSVVNPIWGKGEGGFALLQYNKAIQKLIQPQKSQAVDVCLIACMLFSAFETLRGHHGMALSHVSSGARILSEVHLDANGLLSHEALRLSEHPYVPLSTLELLLNRLDAGASRMVGSAPMVLHDEWSYREPGFCAEIPTAFSSLEEARNSMDYHWNICTTFLVDKASSSPPVADSKISGFDAKLLPHPIAEMRASQPDFDARRLAYSSIMEKWYTAFKTFLQSNGSYLNDQGLQAAQVLEISHHLCDTLLQAGVHDVLVNEMVWDKFTARYQHIVELATSVMEMSFKSRVAHTKGSEFSLDMNIVAPLYAVAHRCRDPAIRRKAVSLLYATPRQEGVWDSYLTASAVERLILIEEEGLGVVSCAQDVPDWARVTEVDVKFDLEGRVGSLGYARSKAASEKARQKVVYTISW